MFHPPKPNPVHPPKDIEVVVITPQVAQEWADEGRSYSYFAFTDQDYLTFSAWIQDVLRYIRQQNAVIDYYRQPTE